MFDVVIVLNRDNVLPPGARSKLHEFLLTSIEKPTTCDVCFRLLRSVAVAALRCFLNCSILTFIRCRIIDYISVANVDISVKFVTGMWIDIGYTMGPKIAF